MNVNPAFGLLSFTASNSLLYVGQITVIAAAVTGGTAPYTYNFVVSDTASSTLTANFLSANNPSAADSFIFKPTVIGTYQVDVAVTDNAAVPESVNDPITLKVVQPLGPVSISPSNTILDSGQAETYTITVFNGVGPFTVGLFNITGSLPQGRPLNAIIASLGGSNTVSFVAGNTGSFSFNGVAIDNGANAFTFNSISSSITVNGNANNINGNVPTVTLTPSSTSLQPGQTETYTVTVYGGTGPFAVSLFNITGSAMQGSPLNAIIASPGGSNTISFTASNPGTFVYDAIATDTGTKPSAFVFNSAGSQITVTQPAQTTTISGGGGGGGGGGGIAGSGGGIVGGGSSMPEVSSGGDGCISVDNVAIPNSFGFYLSNTAFNVTDNYIGSNYTSVIVNGVTYLLYLNVPTTINGTPIYMALTSVSYLPILHSVNMIACPSQSRQVNSLSVYANLGNSTITVTKVVPSYLFNNVSFVESNAPALPGNYSGLFVGNLTINPTTLKTANVTISYQCSMGSGAPEPYLLQGGAWTAITPFSINASACSVSFATQGGHSTIALLSQRKVPAQVQPTIAKTKQSVIIDMFIPPKRQFSWTAAILGLGLAAVSATKLRKKLPRSRQPQHRQGNSNKVIRLIERLAIIEALIFAAMVLLFVLRHSLLSMLVAFGFGIVLAYFVDRIIAARRPDYVYVYKRKRGIRKLIEEVGIIEMVLFVAAVWAYVAKHALLGVVLAFFLGLALSYFIDRIRQVRKMERAARQEGTAAETSGADAPAGTRPEDDAAPAAGAVPTGTASVYAAPAGAMPADSTQGNQHRT